MDEELYRRLRGIEEKLDRVRTEDLPALRVHVATEVSALKVKATIWGAAGGVLGSLAAIVIALVLAMR